MSELNKSIRKLGQNNETLKVEAQTDVKNLAKSILLTTEGVQSNTKSLQEYNRLLQSSNLIHSQAAQGLSNQLCQLSQTLGTVRASQNMDAINACEGFLGTMTTYIEAIREIGAAPTDFAKPVWSSVKKFSTYWARYCEEIRTTKTRELEELQLREHQELQKKVICKEIREYRMTELLLLQERERQEVLRRKVCREIREYRYRRGSDFQMLLSKDLQELQSRELQELRSRIRESKLRTQELKYGETERSQVEKRKSRELEKLRNRIQALSNDIEIFGETRVEEQQRILGSMKEKTAPLNTCEKLLVEKSKEISYKLGQLSSSLRTLEREGQILSQCQSFLKRLHYPSMDTRRRKIEKAHSKTFEWIFSEAEDGEEVDQHQYRFSEWLREGNRPFWIQGKAGSGKSTLMKFVVSHDKTFKNLKHWAGDKELIIASFFFWVAGTPEQKSQEGLLRSLLFEIFRRCPELVLSVTEKLKVLNEVGSVQDTWSFDDLLEIYQKISERNIRRKFCLFIDGLDEFQDKSRSHRDLIQTLRDLNKSPDIKLCVSSRPWMLFEDEFGDSNTWSFKLQDSTKADIRQVVEDKFNDHPQFTKLWKLEPAYYDLIEDVVSRSQGVFLWVHLVLRDLLDGLTYNDSVQTLKIRLQSFPEDLDKFFQHMLDSIPRVYLLRAARMFKIATAAERPIPVLFYSMLEQLEECGDKTIDEPIYGMPISEIKRRQKRMKRVLDGRSRGLLEVVPDESAIPAFLQDKVDFLHRTVRDFLDESGLEFLEREAYRERQGPDLYILACKAAVAMIRRVPTGLKAPMQIWGPLFELFFFFCEKASAQPGSLDTLRDLLERVEVTFDWMITTRYLSNNMTSHYILSYAARYQVRFYLEWKLSQTWYPSALLRRPECPALDYALSGGLQPAAETVRLLLRFGADPNQSFQGSTVWDRFMAALSRLPDNAASYRDQEDDFNVVRYLLLAGAKCNEELRPGSGRWTSVAVIKRYFPAPQATILLACKPSWAGAVTKALWGGIRV